MHGFKVGNKVRQQTILNMGKFEDFPVDKYKALSDRIEMLLTGFESIFNDMHTAIEVLVQRFTREIQSKGLFPSERRKTAIVTAPEKLMRKSIWRAPNRKKAKQSEENGFASKLLTD
ncbi:MAG: hypothetical protein ACJA0X_003095 [Cyclobacteriaceae bacterium]